MHDSFIISTARWIIRGKIQDHHQRILDRRWENLDWDDHWQVVECLNDRSVFDDADNDAEEVIQKMENLDLEGQPGGFDTIVEKVRAYMAEVWAASPNLSPSAAENIGVGRIKQITGDLLNKHYHFAWPEEDC